MGWLSRKSNTIQSNKNQQIGDLLDVDEVFRSRGIPTYTLIDRSHRPEYREIRFKLGAGGLVSVYGDSKSGKTVLCLKILERFNPILLHGPHIQNEAEFWNVLASKIGLGGEQTVTSNSTRAYNTKGSLQVSVGNDALRAEAKVSHARGSSNGEKIKNVFSISPHDIIDRLRDSQRPIVIDDFHAVPKEVQQPIIYKLKPAIDLGVAIVVVSIPEQTEEIVQSLSSRGEIAARHAMIKAPLWEPDEIRQIPVKGFDILNMGIEGSIIDMLTRYSYRNPLLMQDYCRRLCFELETDRALPVKTKIKIPTAQVQKVIEDTASEYTSSYSDYLRLDDEQDGRWKLKSGKTANIYVLIVLALAGLAINSGVKVKTIRDRMTDNLDRDVTPPSEAVIHNALVNMTRRMQGKEDLQAPLRYDSGKSLVYLGHPFFKVFIQWSVFPKYRSGGG